MLSLDSIYIRKDNVITRQIAGETLLVPISGDLASMEQVFMLDPVAAFIWEQLDGKRILNDILQGILDSFEVEKKQAETDAYEFIKMLLEADLILEVS